MHNRLSTRHYRGERKPKTAKNKDEKMRKFASTFFRHESSRHKI